MERDIYWKAVSERDERFNGAFYYGVNSTRIYCKPSCGAKTPNRENVRYFGDCVSAEGAGFRACKRCRPESIKPDPSTEAVIRSCRILEASSDISLGDLGERVGLSPAHLQKLFKEIVGVSPRKYGESVRMNHFREGIRTGSEVTEAMYDAGYGSSSRLYENVSDKLGMTPATYKKGGEGMEIEYTVADCELGKILVARSKKGICAVNFGDTGEDLDKGLMKEFPKAEISKNDGALKQYLEAILENLKGNRKRLVLPLDLQATSFQLRVWEALREIPYGETVSYAEIAKKLGNPNAVRAVAGACAANRVALVIPCHRVVKSNGDLSGYKWGKERKKRLLENEKAER
ncbi:MAG: bifunctional DNA-binding transcriptional regulator/O6-methylguanine-DNA methyltransferase Ada [Acidobacteria bacterium]|nr:MAG: bifunctional DNA-binding transcriptional regulator/O6-methylguanine-DNA methyltransferase Ada [Acidobacteriota bacterium]REK04210.1 MAG: bifunctional DNA-binding transcriptional regulator/O6-methylguanine-DNA methyltransferase Ada [Acidobacteriota bacterium]REK15471.1 MAG: bifunctional DNA-binding transcriptional regulator/O6-methylguanine-DNA methyltransferase Ada [Acidobacteriota bacterium]REK46462.1 MAG: bifunctional DNA-binding transcriptional regulator/O6-methylguanine-DNA methyltra